jgi:hypothetical protein
VFSSFRHHPEIPLLSLLSGVTGCATSKSHFSRSRMAFIACIIAAMLAKKAEQTKD